MNLQEKLKIDREQTPQKLVLFLEGTFYHAYERSAYLATRYLPKLKVACRYKKAADANIATVGFPVSSLPKFAVGFSIEQQEAMLLITLPADAEYKDEDFQLWKSSLAVTNEEEGGPRPSGKTVNSIVSKIRQFPLERRTPLEVMFFLAEIKQQLENMDNKQD